MRLARACARRGMLTRFESNADAPQLRSLVACSCARHSGRRTRRTQVFERPLSNSTSIRRIETRLLVSTYTAQKSRARSSVVCQGSEGLPQSLLFFDAVIANRGSRPELCGSSRDPDEEHHRSTGRSRFVGRMTGDSAKNLVDAGVDRFFVCGGRRVNVLPASDFRERLDMRRSQSRPSRR